MISRTCSSRGTDSPTPTSPWLWADPDSAGAVDVLFVDEAGQFSLANTLAVSQAGASLVLLGDPQQLDQSQKAAHPDGVGVSALEHILAGAKTIPDDRGLFLPITWRLAPAVCAFTSELFYERKLHSLAGLERLDARWGQSHSSGQSPRVPVGTVDSCAGSKRWRGRGDHGPAST